MNKLALTLPGYTSTPIPIPSGMDPGFFSPPPGQAGGANLGYLISQALEVTFIIAGFLLFIWAVIGIFQYIFSGGNKEKVAKARSRITYAFVGFLLIMMALIVSQYVNQILNPADIPITPISTPSPS